MARGKRFSPEQIIAKLRQIEVQLAQGKSLALACKEGGLSEQSRHRSDAPDIRGAHFRKPPPHPAP